MDKPSTSRVVGIASVIWAGSILLSRVMGLVREQIIGRTLGASRQADLYFASFTLPDFLNYLLAAGALSIVFIPMFLRHLESGEERGWQAFSAIANFILVVGTILIILLMVWARPLARIIAPGIEDPGDVDTLVRLMRIIIPAQSFHVIGGLLSAVLQARDRHLLPALAPLVYSASIICGGLIGASSPGMGADGFAWGVLVGSVLGPFGLPLIGCLRTDFRWRPVLSLRNSDLREYLWLSFPIMIGFSIVVVDEWIVKNQASYLAPGTLSYLQYGRTLIKVPIGVFGMAAGVASYPTISRLIAAGSVVEAFTLLCRATRLMLFATFAAQVCLTLAGFEAAYLIWGAFSRRFSAADAQATASVVVFLSLGLSGWAAQTVISRGFYALGSTWTPTIVGTIIAVLAVPLYVTLRVHADAVGLALASSIAITIYVFALGWLEHRRFQQEAAARNTNLAAAPSVLWGALQMASAAAVAIGAGLLGRFFLVQLLPGLSLVEVLARASILCSLGLLIYYVSATMFGLQEAAYITEFVGRKLKRHRSQNAP
jgi:putative peptidoglycan lipid II flippase